MQSALERERKENSEFPAKLSVAGAKMEELSVTRKNGYLTVSPSPRPRPACTCSNRPGSVRCARHGYVVPGERMKKRPQASREILRRAITPPPRRLGLRWLNFRPTPSRLSNMSMA
ncbi:hypothetical protein L6164_018482 [Bauhinia variegata]|uniref:Uncharacterized protein n=1 Tax=Bauhinia variegata TaxID=167791 RepID=A0ACB9NDD9_BAUVA|nr:hypothetical protein L6164_018482 [Bauhinia variegata]